MKTAKIHDARSFQNNSELPTHRPISPNAAPPGYAAIQDELARVLSTILDWPIRAGTLGENYLPPSLKHEADAALARWRTTQQAPAIGR